MLTLTPKQSQLLEELVAHTVANYDKLLAQYLQLRQDVYRLHALGLDPDAVANTRRQLDAVAVQFRHHVHLVVAVLDLAAAPAPGDASSPIAARLDQLEAERQRLEAEIRHINHEQKPMLAQLQRHIDRFYAELKPPRPQRKKGPVDKLAVCKFTRTELEAAVPTHRDEVHASLLRVRTGRDVGNDTLFLFLSRQGAGPPEGTDVFYYNPAVLAVTAPAHTTLEEYDAMIAAVETEIAEMDAHNHEIDGRWMAQAERLAQVEALFEAPDPGAGGTNARGGA